jgi:hypothetical protein
MFLGVRARVGAVKVSVNVEGADVFAGDRFVGTAPLPGEVYVAPGKAHISAKKTGYGEIEGTVEVAAQGTATLALDLASEGPTATSHRLPEPRSKTPAFVLGGITLLTAGVGAALYAYGASQGSAADNLLNELQTTTSQPCISGALGCQTLKSMRQTHDTFVNAGTGMLIVSGGFGAATLIYALWATARPSSASRGLSITPVASSQGGALMLRGSF